jgi:Zn finger protein HypA/HybF involved in hydrogenase expression
VGDIGFYAVLAKLAECASDPEKEARLLLHVQANGAYLGNQVSIDLAKRTQEVYTAKKAAEFAASQKAEGLAVARLYDSDDAKEKGEARRTDMLEQIGAAEEKHAKGPCGSRSAEWECGDCRRVVGTAAGRHPEPCHECGSESFRLVTARPDPNEEKATIKIETRHTFRCFTCGSGGICVDLSQLGVCPSCRKPYTVWTPGDPRGKQQKCAEALP